jgi:hypothetical protein
MNSFDRAYALGAHTLQLGFLKLLHGSALREKAAELGLQYTTSPPYEITASPWLSPEDVRTLKAAESALGRTYNKARFLRTIAYVLKVTGIRPFEFYRGLGEAAPARATPLGDYAGHFHRFCLTLPNVEPDALRRHMLCDWMEMQKGVNMPSFLKTDGNRRKEAAAIAQSVLGRSPGRHEAAILPGTSTCAFVDSQTRSPVTTLYRLHFIDLSSRQSHELANNE